MEGVRERGVKSDSQDFGPESLGGAGWAWEEIRNSTLEMLSLGCLLTHGNIKKKVRYMNLEFRRKVQGTWAWKLRRHQHLENI